jgi:diadenosine tetraphosphate (Ap4A) HIT family hydrolase
MAQVTRSEYDDACRSACFVCRIVEGRPLFANPRIVYEDAESIAFLNQFPSQEGYTIVCPKRHAERFETDLTPEEWAHLQHVVRDVARAVADVTGATRMYVASLGSDERNPHIHMHVCPCPAGTPFEQQQFVAMIGHREISDERLDELAAAIRGALSQSASN